MRCGVTKKPLTRRYDVAEPRPMEGQMQLPTTATQEVWAVRNMKNQVLQHGIKMNQIIVDIVRLKTTLDQKNCR